MRIPEKLYFKIGEVAQLADVKPSVLRFWETEFLFLKPEKSTTGQRLYSRKEVELVLQVRKMLYDQRFTIEGVKQRISPKGHFNKVSDDFPVTVSTPTLVSTTSVSNNSNIGLLLEIKSDLQKMRSSLS